MAKAFPKELREEVVAMALKRDMPVTQIAKNFGVSPASVHQWVHTAERAGQRASTNEPRPSELADAKKRIKTLEMENEILRRAAAYFSRDVLAK